MMERIEELRLDKETERQISELIQICFPVDFGGRSFFQNRHHCRFIVRQDNRLVGHLAVAYRAIRLGDALIDIVGIGEVAVAPEFRRKGYGGQLVDAAVEEGRLAGAEFAALFGQQPIYKKAGFVSVNNEITICEMEGADTGSVVREANHHFMVKPLAGRQWDKNANVDLAGFAF